MRVNIEMTKFNDIHGVFTSKYHCIYKQKVLICQSVYIAYPAEHVVYAALARAGSDREPI
jgi:hypothetical protein